MFRFGRTNGYLTVALIALAAIPLIEAAIVVPQLPETVALAFGAGGEPTRMGGRLELLMTPALCLGLAVMVVVTATRRAKLMGEDSAAAASLSYRRFIKGGFWMVALLNLCTIYLLVCAWLGKGFSLIGL